MEISKGILVDSNDRTLTRTIFSFICKRLILTFAPWESLISRCKGVSCRSNEPFDKSQQQESVNYNARKQEGKQW